MNKPNVLAVLICALVGAGCASPMASETPAISLAYTTENPQAAGVVQVFDIGANTVVQVRNIDTLRPTIVGEGGVTLKYQVFGQNAVLEGRHNVIRVVTLGGTSTIRRNALIEDLHTASASSPQAAVVSQIEPAAAVIPSPDEQDHIDKPKDDSPEALQAEIERMRRELAEIKQLLMHSVPGNSLRPRPTPSKTEPAIAKPSSVIVHFADNSSLFTPTQADSLTIRELARSAKTVTVEGFTDSSTANRHAEVLATRRANAARNYLMSVGISPAKISVRATPSGRFIADNSTKEGKAMNRRVEITMDYASSGSG